MRGLDRGAGGVGRRKGGRLMCGFRGNELACDNSYTGLPYIMLTNTAMATDHRSSIDYDNQLV